MCAAHRRCRSRPPVAAGSCGDDEDSAGAHGSVLGGDGGVACRVSGASWHAEQPGPWAAVAVRVAPQPVAEPLTLWTWSKVVRRVAVAAGVPRFSTHTLRHLCLTDLAQDGMGVPCDRDVRRASQHGLDDAVHPSVRPGSGREAGRGHGQIHAWRVETLAGAGQRCRPVSATPLHSAGHAGGHAVTPCPFGLDLTADDRRMSLTSAETGALAGVGRDGLRRSRARGGCMTTRRGRR